MTPEQIISDEEIARVHGHANFGPSITPREVVNEGVRKYAVGFESGYTQLMILLEHGLITTPRPGSYKANLTKKGKQYARSIYTRPTPDDRLTKAVEALEPFRAAYLAYTGTYRDFQPAVPGTLADQRANEGEREDAAKEAAYEALAAITFDQLNAVNEALAALKAGGES